MVGLRRYDNLRWPVIDGDQPALLPVMPMANAIPPRMILGAVYEMNVAVHHA